MRTFKMTDRKRDETAKHTTGKVEAVEFGIWELDTKDQPDRKQTTYVGSTFPAARDAAVNLANARRLVACWNACEVAGLSTEVLEDTANNPDGEAMSYKQECDALLAALRRIASLEPLPELSAASHDDVTRLASVAKAAIAQAEGKS